MNLLNIFFINSSRVKRHTNNKRSYGEGNIRNADKTSQVIVVAIRNAFKSQVITDDKRIGIKNRPVKYLPKSNLKNAMLPFLSIFVLMVAVSCKKDKGIVNVEWQNESLGLTAEICAKYRECADKEWKSIPENLKKFTEGRLDETQCQKRFRESNAYKLMGADPLAIQTAYKDCHKQILQFSCKDLQEGKIETVSSCEVFQKIQSGD
ncbi:hypothetical protein ND861_03350 [Leptospira sp. 2 VSF19]|uniref:Lipoprotein n=1 Tax=Leptospira soteropolitanensis TaxID=2950025 RepID=A0AAW5VC95_9LEPT|nr:hypothetical protein [Leptospira soteropolitanensis]MCW7491681.1 hypothetical protein [Leptospira soteropolitanensis]MCW7499265.1 hypothetical protein [Leptospira soteropolitanensis]MCW7521143.1 hypothetical protein [Leptospira soteropolitanensis]MCW7525369.1 hypothetical protein [Leptospira soteropolitanensis]MCW7529236.1 hypothetical protein [Leptospira soteropolitanensis]